MPQFTGYPSLQVQVANIPEAMARGRLQAQQFENAQRAGKLQDFQLQSAQGEQERQEQLRGLLPGLAGEYGASPAAQKAVGLDPKMMSEIQGWSKEQKAQFKAKMEPLANIGQIIINTPALARGPLDANLRQGIAAAGLDPNTIPPLGSEGYVAALQTNIATYGDMKPLLESQGPPKEFAPPELIRLQEAHKKEVAAGNEKAANQITARIEKLTQESGMSLTVSKDGTVDFSTKSQKGKKQQERTEKGILAIQSVAAGANLLRALEEGGDETISFTGRTARLIDSFVAQATASAGLVGLKPPPVDRFQFTGALAEAAAVVKSKAISLAFAMAVQRQGSRPTDQDIIYFLDIIGARAGSSRQFAAALKSSIDEGMDSFAIRYREETGSEWDWDAALERNNIQYGGTNAETGGDAEGDTATGPQGEKWEYRNGEWEKM